MNIQSATSMALSPVVLSDDLIAEVLSLLPVKYLLRFRCVSKSWKNLISDPDFVKLHLSRSATQNLLFTLISHHITDLTPGDSSDGSDDVPGLDCSVVPYSMHHLIENPSFTFSIDPYYHLVNKDCYRMVGTCNGLICLSDYSVTDEYREYWFRLWNPATRTTSAIFGRFQDFRNSPPETFSYHGNFNFKFGCDNSTDTYKVVVSRYHPNQQRSIVRILSVGDNVWRDIESFPIVPLHLDFGEYYWNAGVYLSGTLNWLAIHNDIHYNIKDKNITVEQFVIVSLDLGTETYNQYLLPRGFEEVPPTEPTVGVLGDCLCFSYSYKKTDFVLWQMKKFGVEESWTPFLKVSYQNLQIDYNFSDDEMKYRFPLVPLLLSDDDDTLLLKSSQDYQAILYNLRDKRVERTKMTAKSTITDNRTRNYIQWVSTKVYVESLVSTF